MTSADCSTPWKTSTSISLVRFRLKIATGVLPRLVAIASLLILFPAASSAENLTTRISYKSLEAPNACLPDAVGFQNAYQVHQRMRQSAAWSRVLMVHSRSRSDAHAFCVFTLEGKLWAYDQSEGCRRVWLSLQDKADPMKVGRILRPGKFDRALWVDQSF